MKPSIAMLVAAGLGLGAMACGGGSNVAKMPPTQSRTSAGVAQAVQEGQGWDHDGDPKADYNTTNSQFDRDDGEIRYYGQAAGATEGQTITKLVRRYYTAAAAHDGVAGCSLMGVGLAQAFAAQHSPGSRGGSCATVVSKLFEHAPGRTPASLAAVAVVGVRVQGASGLALLRLPDSEVRDIPVEREGEAWKVEALFDSGLG